MAIATLMGWDAAANVWRKLVCNAAGKLIIDPSEIFEDPPTDGEAGKAPTSNWAYDHKADANSHHTKFTTTEHDTAARHPLANLDPLVCSEDEADTKISTHKTDSSAHHVKYTDAEARAAVGYNGTKYWSCPGIHFDSRYPATDNIQKQSYGNIFAGSDGINFCASVNLPQGAVVTRVIVTGNVAASAKTWVLRRITLVSSAMDLMATAQINTEDTTILSGTINNSLFGYFIYTDTLNTNDEIWGATITYTI